MQIRLQKMHFLYFAVQLQLFTQVFSGRSEVDSKYIFQQNKQRSKRDGQFFPQPATEEVDSNLLVALDDCLRDYIECRVESHLVTLKVENYVLSVVGLRDLFYDGGRATSAPGRATLPRRALLVVPFREEAPHCPRDAVPSPWSMAPSRD